MKTIAARDVRAAELDQLGEVVASLNEGSPVRAALDALIASVRAGDDVVVAVSQEQVTPRTAAEMLSMSRTHLYKVMDGGVLPFVRVGRDRRIALADLALFSRNREIERARLAERFAHTENARNQLIRDLAGVEGEDASALGY